MALFNTNRYLDEHSTDSDSQLEVSEGEIPEGGEADAAINAAEAIRSSVIESTGNAGSIGCHCPHRNVHRGVLLRHNPHVPNWMNTPILIPSCYDDIEITLFDAIGLHEILLKNLAGSKINVFFPVQCHVISWIISTQNYPEKRPKPDLFVCAPTGSGKTLCYVLPILQTLISRYVPKIIAVVIVPVQDLARQVARVFTVLARGTSVKVGLMVGDTPLANERRLLVKKRSDGTYGSLVDIVVATPGRLVEHMTTTKGFTLRYLKYLVVDEADNVIENMSQDWYYHLKNHVQTERTAFPNEYLPSRPQKLFFSATMCKDPEKLKHIDLHFPKFFKCISPDQKEDVDYFLPQEVNERFILSKDHNKPLILCDVLKNYEGIVCFVKSTKEAHRLACLISYLSPQYKIQEYTLNIPNPNRESIISDFKKGITHMLITTDRMSRGIDVPNIQCVVSYDPPKFARTYVHRVGRTGRAGKKGTAITLMIGSQVQQFHQIAHQVGHFDGLHMEEKYGSEGVEFLAKALLFIRNKMHVESTKTLQKIKSQKKRKEALKRHRLKNKLGEKLNNR